MQPPRFDQDRETWKQDARQHLATGHNASGTSEGRRVAWKQWVEFNHGQHRFLEWADEPGRRECEDLVMDWIAHQACILRRAHSTVKNKVGHLGEYHVEHTR